MYRTLVPADAMDGNRELTFDGSINDVATVWPLFTALPFCLFIAQGIPHCLSITKEPVLYVFWHIFWSAAQTGKEPVQAESGLPLPYAHYLQIREFHSVSMAEVLVDG